MDVPDSASMFVAYWHSYVDRCATARSLYISPKDARELIVSHELRDNVLISAVTTVKTTVGWLVDRPGAWLEINTLIAYFFAYLFSVKALFSYIS